MNETIQKKLEEKIAEVFDNKDEIKNIVNMLDGLSSDQKSFAFGIIVGRLYNSFYYQSKRVLNRDPKKQEFDEFTKFLKQRETEFLKKILL